MTGGVINVITKSGGNVFSGSVFGFNEGGTLMSNDSTENDRPETTTTVTNLDSRGMSAWTSAATSSRTACGSSAPTTVSDRRSTRIIRDLTAPGSPALGCEILSDIDRDLFSGKLTYRLGDSQRLWMSANADPSTRDGNLFTISGPESTWKGEQKSGAIDPSSPTTAPSAPPSICARSSAATTRNSNTPAPASSCRCRIDQTVSPNIRTGGFGGAFQDSEFTRDSRQDRRDQVPGSARTEGGVDWELQDSSHRPLRGGRWNDQLPASRRRAA